jgi:hypothetical protein
MDSLDWVERLGGWAAILLVVRWMMTRLDKLIDSFQETIATFRTFEAEERKTHEAIMESQKAIIDTQTKILESLEAHLRA